MLARSLCVLLMVGLACGAVWIGKPPAKPKEFAHKEGCFIEEINTVIPYGEEISPIGYCYRISCTEEYINYASCGTVATNDPKCYITEVDLRKPYPLCCSDIKCDLDNTLN